MNNLLHVNKSDKALLAGRAAVIPGPSLLLTKLTVKTGKPDVDADVSLRICSI